MESQQEDVDGIGGVRAFHAGADIVARDAGIAGEIPIDAYGEILHVAGGVGQRAIVEIQLRVANRDFPGAGPLLEDVFFGRDAQEHAEVTIIATLFAGEQVAGLDIEAIEGQIATLGGIEEGDVVFALHRKRPIDPGRFKPHQVDVVRFEKIRVGELRQEVGFGAAAIADLAVGMLIVVGGTEVQEGFALVLEHGQKRDTPADRTGVARVRGPEIIIVDRTENARLPRHALLEGTVADPHAHRTPRHEGRGERPLGKCCVHTAGEDLQTGGLANVADGQVAHVGQVNPLQIGVANARARARKFHLELEREAVDNRTRHIRPRPAENGPVVRVDPRVLRKLTPGRPARVHHDLAAKLDGRVKFRNLRVNDHAVLPENIQPPRLLVARLGMRGRLADLIRPLGGLIGNRLVRTLRLLRHPPGLVHRFFDGLFNGFLRNVLVSTTLLHGLIHWFFNGFFDGFLRGFLRRGLGGKRDILVDALGFRVPRLDFFRQLLGSRLHRFSHGFFHGFFHGWLRRVFVSLFCLGGLGRLSLHAQGDILIDATLLSRLVLFLLRRLGLLLDLRRRLFRLLGLLDLRGDLRRQSLRQRGFYDRGRLRFGGRCCVLRKNRRIRQRDKNPHPAHNNKGKPRIPSAITPSHAHTLRKEVSRRRCTAQTGWP